MAFLGDLRGQVYAVDPANGTLSHVSPLARALFGTQVGDTIEVAQKEAEILEIA